MACQDCFFIISLLSYPTQTTSLLTHPPVDNFPEKLLIHSSIPAYYQENSFKTRVYTVFLCFMGQKGLSTKSVDNPVHRPVSYLKTNHLRGCANFNLHKAGILINLKR